MKVTSATKQEKSTVELVIEVSKEEFEAAVEKVYKKQRNQIHVPGFRKGHAPRKVIEGMYGSGVFYEDAINEVYPDAYEQAIKEQGLDAVAWPKVEIQEVGKDGFTFKALVTVRPEVKLGEYKGLSAVKDEVKVTDKDVDGELKPYIARATRLSAVKRKAKKGDTVVIDFEGFLNGEPFEGGKGEEYSLELGSGSFVPGFEDQLIGVKAGEEKDLDITFPEEYHEGLAGKAVVFKVKVHEVKEKVEPELDDEFAKDVSEFETLAELKEDLKNKLVERREAQAKRAFEESLLAQVMANMEVDIPDAMVDYRADRMMNDYAARLKSQGLSMEQYLGMMGMTLDQMRMQVKLGAVEGIRRELALDAIVAAENIVPTDEEIEAEYAHLSQEYGVPVDDVKIYVPVDDVKKDAANRKAAALVVESGKAVKAKKTAAKKSTAKKEEKGEGAAEEKAEKKPAARKTAKKGTSAVKSAEKTEE